MFVLFPPLAERLGTPGGVNALLLSGGFVVFCAGVFWLRRLRPMDGGEGEWAPRNWRVGLAIAFAAVMSLAIAWQLGFFRSGLQVDTRDPVSYTHLDVYKRQARHDAGQRYDADVRKGLEFV